MIRYLMIILVFAGFLDAKIIGAKYRVSYGVFGEVGIVKTVLHIKNNGTYEINIDANTTGVARAISSNIDEYFQSKGRVVDGLLRPDVYIHRVYRMKTKKTLSLNPKDWKKALKVKNTIMRFKKDVITEQRIYTFDGKQTKNRTKKLKFFAKNDLLSMFFNFKVLSSGFKLKKRTSYKIVGAKRDDGTLSIEPMSVKEQREVFGDVGGHNFIIAINQPIFSSKKGDLFVRVDGDGIGQIAILKDVIFFGDIKATIIKKWEN